MRVYLVGGAVRDQLLSLPVHERDWVVVGAHRDDMIGAGYQQVGKHFPVFLHPETKEEYALARKERKTGAGHQGFDFDTEGVTLQDDLLRRDLTINAIAMDDDGQLYDPYEGAADLRDKVLRHVSPAFVEDPLRILRVARFAAQLPGFTVAEPTLALMQSMCNQQMLSTLSAERLWAEMHKALQCQAPWAFFTVLENCGGYEQLLPTLPPCDQWIEQLQRVCAHTTDSATRFASAFLYAQADLPRLKKHLSLPNPVVKLAQLTQKYAQRLLTTVMQGADYVEVFTAFAAFQDRSELQRFLTVLQATDSERVIQALDAAAAVDYQPLIAQGLTGAELGAAIAHLRATAVDQKLGGR